MQLLKTAVALLGILMIIHLANVVFCLLANMTFLLKKQAGKQYAFMMQ
jgi:hypothetical protein